MNIKLRIKKKYIGILATGICLYSSFVFLQEIYVWLIHQNNFSLILFLAFITSTTYTIYYWISLKNNEKLAKKISRQIANSDSTKESNIKDHLWNKSYEEFYTIDFSRDKNNK